MSIDSFEPLDVTLDGTAMDLAASLGDLFQYQGYNPREFIKTLKAIAKSKSRTLKEFNGDMLAACVFYVTRGTRIGGDKQMGRTSEAGKLRMKELVDTYKIEWKKNIGKEGTKETVTIARIAGCFPHWCAQLMAKIGRLVGTPPSGFPQTYCFAGAPAIIPKDNTTFFDQWLEWAKDFDRVVNGANANPTNVRNYALITFNSDYVPESKRKQWFASLAKV
jgi:hypothetical protein